MSRQPTGRRGVGAVAVSLVVLASLCSDGGSRLGVPAGPATSAPPGARQVTSAGRRPPLTALTGRLAGSPTSASAAIRVVQAGLRKGARGWISSYVAAFRRRVPGAAGRLAEAELALGLGDVERALSLAQAADRARPENPVATHTLAAAYAASGQPLAALGALADVPVSAPGHDDLWIRRPQLASLPPSGDGRLDSAVASWAAAVQRQDVAAQARALLLVSAVEGLARRPAAAARARDRALDLALRAGDARALAMALIREDEAPVSGAGTRRPIDRMVAACRQLSLARDPARADCLVSALGAAWRAGRISDALRILRELDGAELDNPVLTLRAADAVVPLLRGIGQRAAAAARARAAAAAGRALLQPDIEAYYLGVVASLEREMGRRESAATTIYRALGRGRGSADLVAGLLAEAAQVEALRPGGEGKMRALLADAVAAAEAGSDQARAVVTTRAVRLGLVSYLPLERWSARKRAAPAHGGPVGVGPARVVEATRAALLHEAAGETTPALEAYRRALDGLRAWLAEVDDFAVRATVVDAWKDISIRAAGLAFRSGVPRAGVDLVERGRTGGEGLDDGVPVRAGTAILAFAVTGDGVWVATLRGHDVAAIELPISPADLRSRVALWRAAARSGDRQVVEGLSARLGAALLEPVEAAGWLDGIETIQVVPHDALHGLPFHALRGAMGEPYGERFVFARVPSLRLLRAVAERPRSGAGFAGFAPSGGADAAREVGAGARDRDGRVYVAARATETSWKTAARDVAVLHFAGHSRAPSTDLTSGGLWLRSDRFNDGILGIEEIVGQRLPGSLVVLMGCDTASGPGIGGVEGTTPGLPGLSEAFLAAGARAVVGSLLELDDRTARRVAERFYRFGGPEAGARALAQALRSLRRDGLDDPGLHGATVWIGPA